MKNLLYTYPNYTAYTYYQNCPYEIQKIKTGQLTMNTIITDILGET